MTERTERTDNAGVFAHTLRLLALILTLATVASPALAVSVGQIDDFQDGTTQGWFNGAGFVSNSAGGLGGAGDLFMLLESDGDGFGGRLVAQQSAQWAGDYTTAGVDAIRLDLINLGATDLQIRLAISGAGGAFSTIDTVDLGAAGGWTTAEFSVLPGDWTDAGTGVDIGLTLGTVAELRILHSPFPAFGGTISGTPPPFIVAQLGLDRIEALPEPTSAGLALAGLALLALRRRCAAR